MWDPKQESAARAALAERLQAAIRRNGMSHRKLAAELETSKQSVTNWTQGTHEPSLRHLRRLARVLNMPLAQLLGESSGRTAAAPATSGGDDALAIVDELAQLGLRPTLNALHQSVPALLEVLSVAERQAQRGRRKP